MFETSMPTICPRTRRWIHRNRFFPLFFTILISIHAASPILAAPPQGGGPPPTVTVTTVKESEVNPPQEYVGRMEAIQTVDLRARVEGFLDRVAFQEGADVKAGDLLFVIEPAPYQARLKEAQARVAEAEAAATRSRQYLQRLHTVKSGGVSATDLDTAVSTEQQAAARLQEANANLDQARLNLGYTTIRAPISGRIGRTNYTRGNLVGPASGALARIVQMDPIRAVYSISENDFVDSRMAHSAGDRKNPFVPRLKLPNGETYGQNGRIDFIDNEVDPGTGTIAVRAVFENPKGFLLPGQYVTVLVRGSKSRQMPVIPQSAVSEDRNGRYVFVVDDRKTVQLRRISTSDTIRNHWVVESGLTAGETIVVQGVQKVTPGQTVNPTSADKALKE